MPEDMTVDKLITVGQYNQRFNDLLGINITQKNVVRSIGLSKHLIKRNHTNCLPYINRLAEILASPDYIGINPNEADTSIELVKKYAENILVGIKVDISSDTLYVSTMYEIHDSKLQRRIHSGRLIKFEQ